MNQSYSITTSDQETITATCFYPEKSNGKSFLIGAATAVPQKYYRHYARWMASQGYIVFTFDYRGIGESRPESLIGFDAQMNQWGLYDLDAMIVFIKDIYPNMPLYYMGHSVGGQILGMTPESKSIEKAVFVGSTLAYWKLYRNSFKLNLFFIMHLLIPAVVPLMGYFPGDKLGVFKDLPKGVALEWARWCRTPDFLFAYHAASSHHGDLEIPILNYSFSDDDIAQKEPVDALMPKYARASFTRKHIEPQDLNEKEIGHFGFFRKKFQKNLWKGTLEWLENEN